MFILPYQKVMNSHYPIIRGIEVYKNVAATGFEPMSKGASKLETNY